jgi:hypothetical protein
MAIKVLEAGDQQVQIQNICADNLTDVIASETLDWADYIVPDSGLARFRRDMNANFAQLNTDLTVAGIVTMGEGDSWFKCRDICKANWALVDAVVNP